MFFILENIQYQLSDYIKYYPEYYSAWLERIDLKFLFNIKPRPSQNFGLKTSLFKATSKTTMWHTTMCSRLELDCRMIYLPRIRVWTLHKGLLGIGSSLAGEGETEKKQLPKFLDNHKMSPIVSLYHIIISLKRQVHCPPRRINNNENVSKRLDSFQHDTQQNVGCCQNTWYTWHCAKHSYICWKIAMKFTYLKR